MTNQQAIQTMENRIEGLLSAFKSKKWMRADICTWFTSFVQSDAFKQLTETEKTKSVDRFSALLKFFV